MTPDDARAIGRLEGRVLALEGWAERIDGKLDTILERQDADRQSVVDFRVEDLTRQIEAAQRVRASLRPKPERSWLMAVLPWVLVGVGALSTALATWLGG